MLLPPVPQIYHHRRKRGVLRCSVLTQSTRGNEPLECGTPLCAASKAMCITCSSLGGGGVTRCLVQVADDCVLCAACRKMTMTVAVVLCSGVVSMQGYSTCLS